MVVVHRAGQLFCPAHFFLGEMFGVALLQSLKRCVLQIDSFRNDIINFYTIAYCLLPLASHILPYPLFN